MELASAMGMSLGPPEGGAAVLPLFSQVCRHVASWIVVPELSWDLRSVFVPVFVTIQEIGNFQSWVSCCHFTSDAFGRLF